MPISDTEYFRYLPVSDYDKQWGVYVTGVGCTRVPPFSKSYPVSVHPDRYQFHWAGISHLDAARIRSER